MLHILHFAWFLAHRKPSINISFIENPVKIQQSPYVQIILWSTTQRSFVRQTRVSILQGRGWAQKSCRVYEVCAWDPGLQISRVLLYPRYIQSLGIQWSDILGLCVPMSTVNSKYKNEPGRFLKIRNSLLLRKDM